MHDDSARLKGAIKPDSLIERTIAPAAAQDGQAVRLMATAGVALMALSFHAPALAQSEKSEQADVAPGEIIVTAQRREESAVDVPLSVVSQTGEQLQRMGVNNVLDLTFAVPGVKIDQTSNYVQPAIRGVSSGVTGPGTDAPVALYLDGVIQPNQIGNSFKFTDIERIEVLKGPQGTLFGRNATGGAVSIYTKSPSFTPQGHVEIGYGNYDSFTANAFVSGPISQDVVAASVSAFYERTDSYDYDIARNLRPYGLKNYGVRAKLLFIPKCIDQNPWAH